MFINKWLLLEVRTTLVVLFETLNQDSMTILEYNIKSEKLFRYALHLIPTEDDKIGLFSHGLILASERIQLVGGEILPLWTSRT